MAHRSAAVLVVVAALAILTACGGGTASREGDRQATLTALRILSSSSLWQIATRTTLTQSSQPAACVLHIEKTKPLKFKLFMSWIPTATVQRTVFEGQPRAYVWLRAAITKQGAKPDYSLHLGNERSLEALKSHYGDAFSKPFERCVLLANGAFGLPGPNVRKLRTTKQQHSAVGVDPDQDPLGNRDAATVVRTLGNHRYQLVVQNTSPDGFIDNFAWKAWPGATVTGVTGSSRGNCELTDGMISCARLSLAPPTCLCRPGGSMTVDFTATSADENSAVKHGVVDSYLWIGSMTLVPYIIPAHASTKINQADLPLCAKGQLSTSARPCTRR
jgi:hypothetical protein